MPDLQHSQGGKTTRDDATDLGVDMLQGDPSEPQGPEDAFGPGPKRGDYTDRVGDGAHRQVTPSGVVDQNAQASQRGEQAGKKGGVDTDESPPAESDNKPAWVDYAVSQGWDREDAEATNKDDLQKALG